MLETGGHLCRTRRLPTTKNRLTGGYVVFEHARACSLPGDVYALIPRKSECNSLTFISCCGILSKLRVLLYDRCCLPAQIHSHHTSYSVSQESTLPKPIPPLQVHTQRAGAPVFDMVIELKRGEVGTWSVIRNVVVAVDALLGGGSYEVERRSRAERDLRPGNKVR